MSSWQEIRAAERAAWIAGDADRRARVAATAAATAGRVYGIRGATHVLADPAAPAALCGADARTARPDDRPASCAPCVRAALAEHAEPAAAPLVVVPCGRVKLPHAAPAGRLYVGGLHRLARQAADTIAAGIGGRVVILSALHGLLDLAAVVEPYDVTIGDPDAIAPARLAAQLAELAPSRVVALTPNAYTAALLAAADACAVPMVAPLAGSRGLPEQRGRLAALRDGRRLVDEPPTPAPVVEPAGPAQLALFAA